MVHVVQRIFQICGVAAREFVNVDPLFHESFSIWENYRPRMVNFLLEFSFLLGYSPSLNFFLIPQLPPNPLWTLRKTLPWLLRKILFIQSLILWQPQPGILLYQARFYLTLIILQTFKEHLSILQCPCIDLVPLRVGHDVEGL